MAPPVEENVLEDPTLKRRQTSSNDRNTASAVTVPEPVDREVAYDRDEPGRDSCAMVFPVDVAAESLQVVLAQGFAYPRENIHYVVIVSGVMANRREHQATVAIEKQIPGGFRSSLL